MKTSLANLPMPYEWYFNDLRDGIIPQEMKPYREVTISFRCPDYSVHDDILKPLADYMLLILKPYIEGGVNYNEVSKEE